MNDLQQKLYMMFKYFHEICTDNDLEYYMIGGTFLGAIRHRGFIPWDDDIDVGMPRHSYDKLVKILEKKCCSKYSLLSKGYGKKKGDFAYRKLVDNSTTLIENINERRVTGIYLDIFPLDGAPNNKLLRKVRFTYSKFLSYLLWFNSSENMRKKKYIKCICRVFNNRRIYNYLNNYLSAKDFHSSAYGGNYLGNWGYKEIFEIEVLGAPKLYKFEDSYFYGPSDYEHYLTQMYGDYNKLPDIKDRGNHHTFEHMDLSNTYIDSKNIQ